MSAQAIGRPNSRPAAAASGSSLEPDSAAVASQHRQVLPHAAPAIDNAEIGAAAGNLG
jgi:hypothetical protein